MNRRRILCVALAGMLLATGGTTLPAQEGSATEILAKAKAATGQRKFDEAYQFYQEAMKADPELALPALARFVQLTGREKERAELLQSLPQLPVSALAKARALSAVGEDDKALAMLRDGTQARDGSSVAATLFLVRMLQQRGQLEERDNLFLQSLLSAKDDETRSTLFRELMAEPDLRLVDAPSSLTLALDAGLGVGAMDRREVIDRLDPIIIRMQTQANYFALRDEIVKLSEERGAGTAWFATRLLTREERFPDALALIEPLERKHRETAAWPLLAHERAELLRQLGRIEDSKNVYDSIAASVKADRSGPVIREAARVAIAARDTRRALELLATFDPEQLEHDQRRDYYATYLNAVATEGDLDRVIDIYARATSSNTNEDDLEVYRQVIFRMVLETEQHKALEEKVRARFHEQPEETPSNLWRLAAAAAQEARRPPNQLEALYQCVLARPNDVGALSALSDVALPIAVQLAQAPKENLAIPEREVQNLQKVAEQALVLLVKSQPLTPEPTIALLKLYEARGVPEPAKSVAGVVARPSGDGRVMGVCAFALATNGHPAEAALLYDEALAKRPDDMTIRMNRAANLTRLDRWEEAITIYKDVLEKGYLGRRFHVHEMVSRIWDAYAYLKREDEALAYLTSLPERVPKDWREEAMTDTATLLSNKGRVDEGIALYNRILSETKDRELRKRIYEARGSVLFQSNRFPEAANAFEEGARDFEDDPDTYVAFLQGHAEALAQHGELENSVKKFEQIAAEHPEHMVALTGLYRAAELTEAAGRKDEARRLYQAFLNSPSTDFLRRNRAQEQLDTLSQSSAEIPKQ